MSDVLSLVSSLKVDVQRLSARVDDFEKRQTAERDLDRTFHENTMRGGSPLAQNARKVVCLRGHDTFSQDKRGGRRCRTCDAAAHRERDRALQELAR